MQDAESMTKSIWSVPKKPLAKGAWLWWFWLFFIHDENTKSTGKCRQIMILWSVKNDRDIQCNSLPITGAKNIVPDGNNFILDGAAAAWYFDGEIMHENFILERSAMPLNPSDSTLSAPGRAPSSFSLEKDGSFKTEITSGKSHFTLIAKKTDSHPAIGPTYGHTPFVGGMEIEGTRIEILELSGTEETTGNNGKTGKSANEKVSPIHGTAYFQKILLAAPPPQWYWGLYHFADGSFATYMQVYTGRSFFAGNIYGEPKLKRPTISFKEDILVYHAPSGRVFQGGKLSVKPEGIGNGLWRHNFSGSGKDFSIEGIAEAYSHSCWAFRKNIGILPAKSTFKYNEYPSVMKEVKVKLSNGEEILLQNGWGNMENSWGFII